MANVSFASSVISVKLSPDLVEYDPGDLERIDFLASKDLDLA